MQVFFAVRMLVVMAMMGGPPERTSLSRAGAQQSKQKLCDSASLERFVGKVTVIKAGNRKHSCDEERGRENDGEGARAGDQYQEAGQVEGYKGNYTKAVERSRAGIQVI
jgi:hypothetical protein